MDQPFLTAIAQGGIVGDGAMGSLLYERGVFVNRSFDEVCLSQPELVQKVHKEYISAGAQLLETNTYGANRIRLSHFGLSDKVEAINREAVRLAREVAGEHAYVGGSIGPCGHPIDSLDARSAEIEAAYEEQASLLDAAGVDAFVLETFPFAAELRLAIQAVRKISNKPIVAHISVDDAGTIVGNLDPKELALQMHDWGADVVGANCNGPAALFDVIQAMISTGLPVSAMPNAGRPQKIEDRLIYLATPENFGVFARRFFKAGAKIVGGCCGTSPAHITRVSSAARMIVPRRVRRPRIELASHARPPVPLEDRSSFGAKLGRRFVVSVEVNPVPGLDVERPIAAARQLMQAGADVINIADGPRATARMSNLALAIRMQERLGIEPLLHVCCRDRNLLGLQAAVLGAHVLGVRNLVVITGDPPKIGDYPDATAVYDLDSIGLLGLLDHANRGVDPAGKSTDQTRFVLATGAEPGAADFEREMDRLRQKCEAGADVIMTQPIYDPAHLDRFLEATHDIDVPVLVGLLPLASHRNAEFIHQHVPGMAIPDSIRERMRKAGSGESGRREGVQIALESLEGVRNRVAGAYIMPPLNRFEMAAEILESIGNNRDVSPGIPGYRGDLSTQSAVAGQRG